MAIRWVSTPESIKANQPSVLAIVETLAAMGIAVWIAVTWNTYVHIAIGGCIAPLLLMRTDESCIRARRCWGTLNNRTDTLLKTIERSSNLLKWPIYVLFGPLFCFLYLFIGTPVCRFYAWLTTLVQHPVASISAVPHNWRHSAMVLDSRQSPHIFNPPATAPHGEDFWYPTTAEFRKKMIDGQGLAWASIIFVYLVPFITFAYAYRWSVKTTALIWFPLLWSMQSTKEVDGPLQSCLTVYRRDPFKKIVVGVSIAAIVAFIVKLILHYEWAGFAEWWSETPLRRFFALYVSPLEIQKWQIAMAINSGIAIVMYILAGRWLVRMEYARMTDETWPRRVFKTGLFIRPILSFYTIACMIYITIIAAWDFPLPALGEKWFPWQ